MDIGCDTVDRAVVSNTKGLGLESRLLPTLFVLSVLLLIEVIKGQKIRKGAQEWHIKIKVGKC